jgi:hypothetical protein
VWVGFLGRPPLPRRSCVKDGHSAVLDLRNPRSQKRDLGHPDCRLCEGHPPDSQVSKARPGHPLLWLIQIWATRQIPFGNDRQRSKGKCKCKSNDKCLLADTVVSQVSEARPGAPSFLAYSDVGDPPMGIIVAGYSKRRSLGMMEK